MGKKLYVGNLPFSVTSEKLKELFSAYGEVQAEVISFKDTGKSKGFGFVTVTDDVQADKAKQEMNGKEVDGRKVFVNEATPFDPNKPRTRSFGGRGGGGRGGFGGNRGGGGGFRRRNDRNDRDYQDD